MFNKIIFLIFRNNYRFSALGNFAKSNRYGNFFLISLSGRFKSIIGKFLYFLKLGKFISIDGDPFLKDKNISFNLWLTGTSLKISKEFRNYENNFVNLSNPIIGKELKIFQIYPIVKKNYRINKQPKITFMGKIFWQPGEDNFINSEILLKNKDRIIKDFSLVDNNKFWSEINDNENNSIKFGNYKILKTYLREQIILQIYKNFKEKFIIFGEDRKETGINFLKPVFNFKKIKRIYSGNICIDTGSILGSLSLHPRSINIIESGGLLIQAKQNDADLIWKNLNEKIIFNGIDKLLSGIDMYLTEPKKSNEVLDMIFERFRDSKKIIEKNLKESFKIF